MRDSFNKFKKIIILEVLIKCLVIGFSIGLISFSIPLIVIKLKELDFKTIYLVLIALGAWIIISGVLFLLLKPNDKKIAKRIDTDLKLKEKVQTMLEFEKEDSFMINLQREDTIKTLSSSSIKELTIKISLFLIILFSLSMVLGVTAVAIPAPEVITPCEKHIDENVDGICDVCGEVVEIDPNYQIDKWEILSILQLIEKVEKSNIDEHLKALYITELTKLVVDLESVDKVSQMTAVVKTLISKLELELDIVNTNNEVYSVLKTSDIGLIIGMAEDIRVLNVEKVSDALDGFLILISGSKEAIREVETSFGQLLKSSNLNKNDELYLALVAFGNAINDCSANSDVNTAVKEAIKNNKERVVLDLTKQKENSDITEYVVTGLKEIFGIIDDGENNTNNDDSNQDSNNSNDRDDDIDEDELENGNSGGLGTGEVIYGSDDTFFDPEQGYVEYGDVVTQYYSDIFQKLNEGILPEEYREYFEKYFDILLKAEQEEKEE